MEIFLPVPGTVPVLGYFCIDLLCKMCEQKKLPTRGLIARKLKSILIGLLPGL